MYPIIYSTVPPFIFVININLKTVVTPSPAPFAENFRRSGISRHSHKRILMDILFCFYLVAPCVSFSQISYMNSFCLYLAHHNSPFMSDSIIATVYSPRYLKLLPSVWKYSPDNIRLLPFNNGRHILSDVAS
jgi:hypothetical protein